MENKSKPNVEYQQGQAAVWVKTKEELINVRSGQQEIHESKTGAGVLESMVTGREFAGRVHKQHLE